MQSRPDRRMPVIPEALRLANEARLREPLDVLNKLGRRAHVAALWREDHRARGRWVYLERMLPEAFDYDDIIARYGGGAYRLRLFGAWDRSRRCERYLTQVTFWIDERYPPTPTTLARLAARSLGARV